MMYDKMINALGTLSAQWAYSIKVDLVFFVLCCPIGEGVDI